MAERLNGMKKGFTLVEMLVVIGILGVLMGAGMATFSSANKKAQRAKAQELVINVATALDAIYQREGQWPRRIIAEGKSDGKMDENVAYELAKRGVMSLTRDDGAKKTSAGDKCGIVSPWAQNVVKRNGTSASLSNKVPTGGTVRDHLVHFAVDTEGLGYVEASVGGERIKIRATAVAWVCGPDGSRSYSYTEGLKRGCSYSWSRAQLDK